MILLQITVLEMVIIVVVPILVTAALLVGMALGVYWLCRRSLSEDPDSDYCCE